VERGRSKMSLKGTIGDFGTAQILQLIASQRKTGHLNLYFGEDQVHVLFETGEIVGVEQPTRTSEKRLGAVLVAAELLSLNELEQALEAQRSAGGAKKLGEVLVEREMVSAKVIAELAGVQVRETLDALFQWTGGEYEFIAVPVERPADSAAVFSAESVVL